MAQTRRMTPSSIVNDITTMARPSPSRPTTPRTAVDGVRRQAQAADAHITKQAGPDLVAPSHRRARRAHQSAGIGFAHHVRVEQLSEGGQVATAAGGNKPFDNRCVTCHQLHETYQCGALPH
jgi:hypothetical protein